MAEVATGARLLTREERLENACRAVLLFYQAPFWNEPNRAMWEMLTGTSEATTRVLCDTVRRALGDRHA